MTTETAAMSEPNGNRYPTWKWLAGLLALMLVGVCGSWASGVNEKLAKVEEVREQLAAISAKLDFLIKEQHR